MTKTTRKSDKPYKAQANLDILFGEDPPETSTTGQIISLAQIILPASQPRRYFDPEKLNQLAQSIGEYGILENLLVRPLDNNQYELVAGERRYRASLLAGLTEVPVTVKELTDQQALEIALIENLQREDLNPVEETQGILLLLAHRLQLEVEGVKSLLYRLHNQVTGKITNNVIGKSKLETEITNNVIGKSEIEAVERIFTELGLMRWESFVSNRLPVLNLPDEILKALQKGQIAYTKAKVIATVKNQLKREELLTCAIEEKLSLTQIKEKITQLKQQSKTKEINPSQKVKVFSQQLTQSKLWQKDPKKWRKIQNLMAKIELLLLEES